MALHSSGDDSALWLAANTPGTYVAIIQTHDATSGPTNTVSVSFTTTGAPASFTMDVNSPSVPLSTSNSGMFTLKVKDANGAYTQPQWVDGADLATTETGALWFTGASDDSTVTGAELFDGEFDLTLVSAATAGSFTASATPTGTPWASKASGSYDVINNVSATEITMTESSTVADVTAATAGAGSAIVKPGTTELQFDVKVSTSDAGKPVVISVGGTAKDDTTTHVVETDASGVGTRTVSVTSANAIAGKTIIVSNGSSVMTATYTIGEVYYNLVSRAPAAGTIALATGTTKDIDFTVDDSYGTGQANYIVVATSDSASGSQKVSGTTNSSGEVTISLPDLSSASDTSVDWTFRVNKPGTGTEISAGSGAASNLDLTLEYSESGTVTLSDLEYNGTAAADYTTTPAVPYAGVVEAASATDDSYTLTAVSVTVDVANTEVTFSGGDDCSGVWFTKSNSRVADLGTAVAAGTLVECSVTVVASGSTATAYVTSTATGSVEVDAFSSSGDELKGSITFVNASAAAYNVAVSANPTKASVTSTSAITVTVTDVFGNPVAISGGGQSVTLVTDLGTIAGGTNIYTVGATTGAGTATVSAASANAGTATITASGNGGYFGVSEAGNDLPYTGAPDSVAADATAVEFTTAPTDMTIAISGERGTVKGKPGIMVDGITTGISEDEAVIPYIKFPGETSYSAGSARPKVDAEGEFYWQRKTGKKIYVYFVLESDMDVRSERIIIQAK